MDRITLSVPADFWDAAQRGEHVKEQGVPYEPVREDVVCQTEGDTRVIGSEFVFEGADRGGADDAAVLRSLVNLLASGPETEIVLKRGG